MMTMMVCGGHAFLGAIKVIDYDNNGDDDDYEKIQ